MFHNETSNPRTTLTRGKKVRAERRIRHNLTQTIHPPNLNLLAFSHKKTYWVAWRKPQDGFIKINFDDPSHPICKRRLYHLQLGRKV